MTTSLVCAAASRASISSGSRPAPSMRRIEKPAPDTRSQAAFSLRSDRRKQVSCPRTATASASARHLRRWPKPIVAAASVRKVKRFGKRGLHVPASVAAQRGAERLDDAVDVTLVHRRIERQRERSEEHTSELQSLMRNSYAVFCLKKK